METVGGGLLVIAPADWQVRDAADLVEHDRSVTDGRRDDRIAAPSEHADEGVHGPAPAGVTRMAAGTRASMAHGPGRVQGRTSRRPAPVLAGTLGPGPGSAG